MTTKCYFCGKESSHNLNWSHWVVTGEGEFGGHYIRVNYCHDCSDKIVRYKAPKRPRRKRVVPEKGDRALVGKFLGAAKGKK